MILKRCTFVIRWEYRRCFNWDLLLRLFIMHNCSNFNHNAATEFSFKMSWRILFERWRCIWNRAFWFVCCFSSKVQVAGILSNFNESSKSIWMNTVRIFSCHKENLVLWFNSEISYFIVVMAKKPRSSHKFQYQKFWYQFVMKIWDDIGLIQYQIVGKK